MAPLNDEQLNQIRDERKEQIMGAALKVFARKGIIGTKMSMIAAEAGISHGLLYHYFQSKDELFTTLVHRAVVGAHEEMANLEKLPGSPIDKIRILTEATMDESGTPYFMLMHQARTSDGVPEKARQYIEQYSMKTFIEQLLPVFKEGQRLGEVAAGDPEELISSYLSVLSGLMVLNAQQDEYYRLPDINILMRLVKS
ncbi:TetR/AcrR family transcriptional regulator [Paenibacillus filicis]|uniref:TetR/AcrR family transcriptional regulator n=1 Tax=Paenibacillus gyeongsangnamensis TaxID=3388067 RepID=A0ABT4QJY3_9BACL|nr:TetR/AcrR family transcriptional regulator [Paenibacillus filicis]MCZ8517187.1 TetR/AcrR family transcriptional regulator [Paenibacillus filicis]